MSNSHFFSSFSSNLALLREEFSAAPRALQVLIGPRQVGKTTLALRIIADLKLPSHFAAADSSPPHGPEWIEQQWQRARSLTAPGVLSLLVLDEIQKISGWSEVVKRLWDEDRRAARKLHVLLLGSSSLLLQHGLSESLAGRYFLRRLSHWGFAEMTATFGLSVDEWIFFGGYPGAASYIKNESEWRRFIVDSLIEAVLARDVLQMSPVRKPALLRNLFYFATRFPAQIYSYTKMLGQLQDAGNVTTLAAYLALFDQAFLLKGLEQYGARQRGSSPKLLMLNNALVSASAAPSFAQARSDPSWWGRLVENAVGLHIANSLPDSSWQLHYWRERSREVDFLLSHGGTVWGLEVKSGRSDRGAVSLRDFKGKFPGAIPVTIGSDGIEIENFLACEPVKLLTDLRG